MFQNAQKHPPRPISGSRSIRWEQLCYTIWNRLKLIYINEVYYKKKHDRIWCTYHLSSFYWGTKKILYTLQYLKHCLWTIIAGNGFSVMIKVFKLTTFCIFRGVYKCHKSYTRLDKKKKKIRERYCI